MQSAALGNLGSEQSFATLGMNGRFRKKAVGNAAKSDVHCF
jgi:hypothetical protein